MVDIISFSEALSDAAQYSTKHLLLGNGFSIACIPSIFSYSSLYERTDLNSYPEIKQAFEKLGTTDFELIIHALENAYTVLPAYDDCLGDLCKKMDSDSSKLKELLIETIAENHPPLPSEVEEQKVKACRKFLSNFLYKDSRSKVYSLNYDLLLYWTLMHSLEEEDFQLSHIDGFGREAWFEEGQSYVSDVLTWDGTSTNQNIHYLHGALHLFDSGHQLEKFSWTDTGIRLIEQARKALESGKFPLFVTEGNSAKKMDKITHSAYLFHSFRSFESIANAGRGRPGNTCLFTFGVSFSDNDRHIFNKIANGRIKHLYVSLYGDPQSESNKNIIALAEGLKSGRNAHPLGITYYDAASANVWGN